MSLTENIKAGMDEAKADDIASFNGAIRHTEQILRQLRSQLHDGKELEQFLVNLRADLLARRQSLERTLDPSTSQLHNLLDEDWLAAQADQLQREGKQFDAAHLSFAMSANEPPVELSTMSFTGELHRVQCERCGRVKDADADCPMCAGHPEDADRFE